MHRRFRLRNSADFANLRRHGKTLHHQLVIFVFAKNNKQASRFGFIASRRVGGAVTRNRVKRLLREAVRNHIAEIESGWDCLFITKAAAANASCDEIATAVSLLFQSSGIVQSLD